MIATAALAAVAALFAGGANAMLLDVEGGSGGGSVGRAGDPAADDPLPQPRHRRRREPVQRAGVEPKLTGVHAALHAGRRRVAGGGRRARSGDPDGDRGRTRPTPGGDGRAADRSPTSATGSASTRAQFSGSVARAHRRLPADAGLGSRARGPDGRLGPDAVSGHQVTLPATSGGTDADWTWFGFGAGMAALLAAALAGVLLTRAQSQQSCTPVATVRHGNEAGRSGGPPRFAGPCRPRRRRVPSHAGMSGKGTSSGTQDSAARPGQEAGLDEQGQCVALHDRPPVEALDREPAAAVRSDPADEGGERRAEPVAVGVAERQQRPAAALDVEHGLTAEEDDVRAGDACGPRARRASATAGRRRTAVPDRRPRGRAARRRRASRSSLSRSTAPGSANWAPPSPSTK